MRADLPAGSFDPMGRAPTFGLDCGGLAADFTGLTPMKLRHILTALATALACVLLTSCKSGQGPLLINLSGETARLQVRAESGESFDGTCDDQAAVWVGRAGVATMRVEIRMSAASYVLEGDELRTPFGKDEATAFVLEAAGPRKITMREAGMIMRNRPEVHRPR